MHKQVIGIFPASIPKGILCPLGDTLVNRPQMFKSAASEAGDIYFRKYHKPEFPSPITDPLENNNNLSKPKAGLIDLSLNYTPINNYPTTPLPSPKLFNDHLNRKPKNKKDGTKYNYNKLRKRFLDKPKKTRRVNKNTEIPIRNKEQVISIELPVSCPKLTTAIPYVILSIVLILVYLHNCRKTIFPHFNKKVNNNNN